MFDRTAAELWRVAAHLCRDRHLAEDAVQGSLLAAIEHRDDWDSARPLLPWLLGMLLNRVREGRRRQMREPDVARLAPPDVSDPAQLAEHAEFGEAFAAALPRVQEPYRTVLERHLLHGRKAHQIASELGVPAGTVRMRLSRGLDQLRRKLPQGFVAGGAVALRVPEASFAAMRKVVLDAVPRGAATAVGSGHVVMTGIGVLLMKKTMLAAVAMVVLAVGGWALWPAWSESGTSPGTPTVVAAAVEPAPPPPVGREATPVAAPDRRDVTPAPVAAPGMGLLHVVVRHGGTGAPIAGEELEVVPGMLRDPAVDPGQGRSGSVAADEVRRGTTDDAGVATFELPPGFASVHGSRLTNFPSAHIVAGHRADLVVDLPVRLSVDVTVLDADGRPCPGARILGQPGVAGTLVPERELGRAGSDGHWRDGLLETAAAVRAVAPGCAASDTAELHESPATATLRLGAAAATVTGTVRALDGTVVPLAGVAIQPQTASARTSRPLLLRADAQGHFACDCVPPGPCVVFAWREVAKDQRRFAKTAATAVANARTVADVQFTRGARVVAQLQRGTGDGYAGLNVVAVLYSNEVPWDFATAAAAQCRTDDRGECTLDGVMPGDYELQVATAGELLRQRVELGEGQDYRLEHVFANDSWLGLSVLDPARRPLAGWEVTLHRSEDTTRQARTDEQGRVRFDQLPDGACQVEVRKSNRHMPSLVREVTTGSDTELVLAQATMPDSTLRGLLVPAPGTAIADLTVQLFSSERHELLLPPRVDGVVDAASGRFTFAELPAGRYGLMVTQQRGRALCAVRAPIEVAAGCEVDLGAIDAGPAAIVCEVASSAAAPRELFAAIGAPETMRSMVALPASQAFMALAFTRPPQQLDGATVEIAGMPAATYPLLVWGADIAPVLTTVTSIAGQRTRVPVTAVPATSTTFRFVATTGTRNFGVVTLQRGGAALVGEMVDTSHAYVRGLLPGNYRIEYQGQDGSHGAADFTVGAQPGPTIEVQIGK